MVRVGDYVLVPAFKWFEANQSIGIFLYVFLYGGLTLVFVPASLLNMGAGFLFQPLYEALAVVMAGSIIGLTGCFLLGRYCFRGWVQRKVAENRRLQFIDQAISTEGMSVPLLIQAS